MPLSKFRKPMQRSVSPMPEDTTNGFAGLNSDKSMGRDETEVELEKLVFGDDSGFYEGLKSYREPDTDFRGPVDGKRQRARGALEKEELENLDDADLFFLDSTPSVVNVPDVLPQSAPDQDPTDSDDDNAAAWKDSDDQRIVVSLASNPRTRKLMAEGSEGLVNGKEYSKRLRRQFERLYPVPKWANPSAAKKVASTGRRKLSTASESSEANTSADDLSVGSAKLSTNPLAKLLQNANSLTQFTSTGSATRKKLLPEFIDIHRTKDIGTTQPSAVTNLAFHPVHSLLLSSGPSSTLFLHHISPHPPNPNPLLTTLHVGSTPLTASLFHPPSGKKIFFSGRRRYFHIWDLDTGKVEGIAGDWAWRGTAKYGAIQAKPVWPLGGFCGLGPKPRETGPG